MPIQSGGSDRRITKCSIRNHCVVNELMDDYSTDVPPSMFDCQLISFLSSIEMERLFCMFFIHIHMKCLVRM